MFEIYNSIPNRKSKYRFDMESFSKNAYIKLGNNCYLYFCANSAETELLKLRQTSAAKSFPH